jgi:hypothetical protein
VARTPGPEPSNVAAIGGRLGVFKERLSVTSSCSPETSRLPVCRPLPARFPVEYARRATASGSTWLAISIVSVSDELATVAPGLRSGSPELLDRRTVPADRLSVLLVRFEVIIILTRMIVTNQLISQQNFGSSRSKYFAITGISRRIAIACNSIIHDAECSDPVSGNAGMRSER